jgi:UDPglucose 6-dehydrogenase
MKNVSVFGLGKVGLTLVSCLGKAGLRVIGVDVNPDIVKSINNGTIRMPEPGVTERLQALARGQVTATRDAAEAVRNSDLSFVIVPTPSNMLSGFSNRYVINVCEQIGRAVREKQTEHTVSVVSTMLPGSSDAQIIPLLERTAGRKMGDGLGYCYNPSFIAIGEVVKGLEQPDYLLVGEATRQSGDVVIEAHRAMLQNDAPMERMRPIEAEIAKIASNTHETMRVTFANMLLSLCAEVPGANVDRITQALAHRMGRRFFKGAVPYGGPCWPRDNQALSAFMDAIGAPSQLPRTIDLCNAEHGRYVLRKILEIAAPGSKVGIIGLAYKPGTSMIERSYSVELLNWLLAEGRKVTVWDPQAMDEVRGAVGDAVTYCADSSDCLAQSDVVVVALPLPALQEIRWQAAENATVIDCWRVMPAEARATVGRYIPLGVGEERDIGEWLQHVAGKRFDLLSN